MRVKLRSLAEEARIIRNYERKLRKRWRKEKAQEKAESLQETYGKLHRHRVVALRREARAGYLAYGFLRGRPYNTIEERTKIPLVFSTCGNLPAMPFLPWGYSEQIIKKVCETVSKFDEKPVDWPKDFRSQQNIICTWIDKTKI